MNRKEKNVNEKTKTEMISSTTQTSDNARHKIYILSLFLFYFDQSVDGDDMSINAGTENDYITLKQGQVTYLVTIKLSKEVLAAIKLSQVKVKSPTKKQENSSIRENQINQYNVLVLKQDRELRYSKRRSKTLESTNDCPSSSPSKKKVKFLL